MKVMLRILALTLVTLLLTACGSGSPEETLSEFYETIADNDADKAISYFSIEGLKESEMAMAKGKLQMVVGEFYAQTESKNGLDKIEVTNVVFNEDKTQAEATVQLTFGNGEIKRNTDNLVKEKDGWKISL